MMCSKDRFYQEFVVEGTEFKKAKHDFLRRVTEYYEIMREPKVDVKAGDFIKATGGTVTTTNRRASRSGSAWYRRDGSGWCWCACWC